MEGVEIVGLVAVVGLVGFAAVLAIAETSLTHMGRGRAAALVEEGEPRAAALGWLLQDRQRVLNPILLIRLACHLGTATIVAALAERRFGLAGAAIALPIELVVVFVAAEAMPKTYALLATDRAALRVTPLVRAIAALAPLRWAARLLVGASNVLLPGTGRVTGPAVSEEELLALAGVAVTDEVIDADEREIIERTIEFGDTIVREVMVPRPDMVTVTADFRVPDVMEVAILNGFSRLPVTGGSVDDIVGIAYVKDLMRAERDGHAGTVDELMRPANFVPETKRVAPLLREMQAEKNHMAIVVDEYGGTAGLVTLEDLIEELVGEIADEYDVAELAVERLDSGAVRVSARMNLGDLNELLGVELPEGDWDSVGGLLIGVLGHVPQEGEWADVDGHRLRAEKVQGRRIGRVVITPLDR